MPWYKIFIIILFQIFLQMFCKSWILWSSYSNLFVPRYWNKSLFFVIRFSFYLPRMLWSYTTIMQILFALEQQIDWKYPSASKMSSHVCRTRNVYWDSHVPFCDQNVNNKVGLVSCYFFHPFIAISVVDVKKNELT